MKSSKTSFLRNCISGWNVRQIKRVVRVHTIRYYFGIFAGDITRASRAFAT